MTPLTEPSPFTPAARQLAQVLGYTSADEPPTWSQMLAEVADLRRVPSGRGVPADAAPAAARGHALRGQLLQLHPFPGTDSATLYVQAYADGTTYLALVEHRPGGREVSAGGYVGGLAAEELGGQLVAALASKRAAEVAEAALLGDVAGWRPTGIASALAGPTTTPTDDEPTGA